MSPNSGPPIIGDPGSLRVVVARLAATGRVAIDTEAASFHRYQDRVYLVQLSSDVETVLVDPLPTRDLGPIGALLAEPSVEVVFHDADYDLRILNRDYGFQATRVFDTRIAAQLLGEPGIGLSALLEKYFSVRLDKKLQRADWSARPLTPEMVAYAAADTTHLLRLRDIMANRLEAAGRLRWAEEEFERLEAIRWTPPDREAAHLQLSGARALSPRGREILRALYEWRDACARTLDRPPFRVAPNEALVAVARAAPTTPGTLFRVAGLPPSIARRYQADLLEAVRTGSEREIPRGTRPRPGPGRPDPATEARLASLKQLRSRRAQSLGLEPGVLCPNATLLAIARLAPRSAGQIGAVQELRGWQRVALGDEGILKAIAEAETQ
jgi:ribonuclease D